jgi:hypothetical protein
MILREPKTGFSKKPIENKDINFGNRAPVTMTMK